MAGGNAEEWRNWVKQKLENGVPPDTVQEQLITEGWDIQRATSFVNDVHATLQNATEPEDTQPSEAEGSALPSPKTIITGVKAVPILAASVLAVLGLLQLSILSILYFIGLGTSIIRGNLWSWGLILSFAYLGIFVMMTVFMGLIQLLVSA